MDNVQNCDSYTRIESIKNIVTDYFTVHKFDRYLKVSLLVCDLCIII
jgi:hypothetical protein